MISANIRLGARLLGMLFWLAACSDGGATMGGITTPSAGDTPWPGGAGTGISTGTSGTGTAGVRATVSGAGADAAGVGAAGRGLTPPASQPGAAGMSAPSGMAGQASPSMAGSGMAPAGAGSPGMVMAGAGAAAGGSAAGSGMPPMASGMGCTPPPATAKFQVMTKSGGPGGNYTIVQPTMLGENGFKHPPVAWGNGLATTPSLYVELLNAIAAEGFVVIANPGTGSDPQVVRQGLEWLIAQGNSGEYAGKLAKNCAGTIGYSMGGGAAVGSGSHPEVRAIVSIHGLPDASARASGPILLTTSDNDGFVTKSGFVMPCYNSSTVQPTILATHIENAAADFNGHLEPLGNGGKDAAPAIAWLRYWLYGDQAQKNWFYGKDCKLCTAPWGGILRKNHMWE